MSKNKNSKKIKKYLIIILGILLFILLFGGGLATGYFYFKKNSQPPPSSITKENIYINFLSEVYDKIKENYWEKTTDENLINIFKLGTEKLISTQQNLKKNNKEELMAILENLIKQIEEDKKKEFSIKLAHIVLQNLKPLGRNGLYTKKDEENLENKVRNVNPETGEVEPTIYVKLVRPKILHIHIKRMSPTTLDEFKKAVDSFDNVSGLDSLILDLRANIVAQLTSFLTF